MKRREGLVFYRRRKKLNMNLVKEVIVWVIQIIFVLMFSGFISFLFLKQVVVIGDSMLPNFENGQIVLANRLQYFFAEPKVGDIIAFQPYGNETVHFYVKRIVGVPGDVLQIRYGELYRNGEVVDKEFDKIEDAGNLVNEITLEANQYFVLGDNRNSSEDSRSTNVGLVEKEYILGKIWFALSSENNTSLLIK